jgi:uncharacterized delta-60 repeat protein
MSPGGNYPTFASPETVVLKGHGASANLGDYRVSLDELGGLRVDVLDSSGRLASTCGYYSVSSLPRGETFVLADSERVALPLSVTCVYEPPSGGGGILDMGIAMIEATLHGSDAFHIRGDAAPLEGLRTLPPGGLSGAFQSRRVATPAAPPQAAPNRARVEPPSRLGAKPDPAFNERGAVFSSFRGEPSDAESLCVQPDGRIIVAGTVGRSQARRMAVARYLPDGKLDEGFGEGGWAIVDTRGRDDRAHAVALQDNGKIVIAGESLDVDTNRAVFAVARLDKDGTLDKSFSGGGVALIDDWGLLLGLKTARAQSVVIDDDSKIVAAGYGTYTEKQEFFALARYNADGTFDETFGIDGKVRAGFGRFLSGDEYSHAYAVTTQPTGEIVAAGWTRTGPSELTQGRRPRKKDQMDIAVMRFARSGTLDSSFGGTGRSSIDLGMDASAQAVWLQQDGKIILAGAAGDTAGEKRHFALARLDGNGMLDATFNRDDAGITTAVMGAVNGIVIDPNGAILAAGYQMVGDRDRFALARYNSDGRLDGVSLFDLAGVVDRANDIAVDREGKILLAGTTRVTQDKMEFALARVLPI